MVAGAARELGSPAEISQYIGKVLRHKRSLLDTLHVADEDARAKRREADKAEARCYLNAGGSIPERKYRADLDPVVDAARGEADVAEAMVAHLRRLVAQCADELDGARTAAATVRAELGVLGLTSENS